MVIAFGFTVPLLLFPVRLMVVKLLEYTAPGSLELGRDGDAEVNADAGHVRLPAALHFVVTFVILVRIRREKNIDCVCPLIGTLKP